MSGDNDLAVTLEHLQGLEFKVTFDWPEAGAIAMDEPEPLGGRKGPNASRLLAAAVGNCLTASLMYCLQRSKLPLAGARTRVTARTERNDKGRLRMGGFSVVIDLPVAAAEREKLERCLGLFEDYCTVSAAVRRGIPIAVEVRDRDGGVLHASAQ